MHSTLAAVQPRITRPSLAERMRGALERGPLIVCAEAGFGKTSALQEALAEVPSVAWVSCRETDRDGQRLLLRVIERLGEVAPGAVNVLAERGAAPPPVDVAGLTGDLVSELQRLLVDRVTLVIDDAEVLAQSSDALEVVNGLIGDAGATYGVAVATRVPLPLRLAKLRATGHLQEVGAADLAFSPEECAELMRAQGNRPPDAAEVERVLRSTQGWPLGVALGAAAGAGAPEASSERLFDFLEQEILDALPEGLRHRLLASSVLPELEPQLLDAVGLDKQLIDDVRRIGLPLRPRSDRDVAAYHPLVQEFLSSRLEIECPGRVPELHARAASALAAAGRELEAVDQWLLAERFGDALAAIAAQQAAGAAAAPESIARWLDAIPEELRAAPTCRLLEGHLDWSRGRHERAVSNLTAAVSGFRAEGNELLEWSARFALCDPLGMTGRFEEMAQIADGFDSAGREAGLAAAGTGFYGAIALGCLGRIDELERCVARLMDHPAGAMFRSLRAAWEQFSHVPRGAFDELWRAVDDAIDEYERADPLNKLPQQLLVGALVHMDQGREDEARDMWLRMEEVATRRHIPYLVSLAHAERARVHVGRGRPDDAESELARAGPTPPGWQGYAWELARAGVAAQRGRPAEALAGAERTLALAASTTVLERERIALELVPILFEAGAPARAEALATDALGLLDAHFPGDAGCYLRSLLLGQRAWMRQTGGDTDAAVAELQRAWAQAGSNQPDFLRRLGDRIRVPLWAALERRVIGAEEVIRAHEHAQPGGDALFEYTRHPLPEVRRRAAVSLAASGRPDVLARLGELAADPDPAVAEAAAAIRARVVADPPPLSFQLLGGFAVRRGSWQPDDAAWERRIAQRLVRLLLTRQDTPVSEDELIDAFWHDKGVEAARRSLQVALSSARRVVDLPGAESVIVMAERAYRLRLRPRDSVDVDAFERAAASALEAPSAERLGLLERAEGLWGGEPLPEERYSDWAIPWREALHDRHAAILEALVGSYLAAGELTAAVDAARKLVAIDPMNEAAQRILIRCYARSGRRAHALRQYLECRRLLTAELGLEPALETSELQRQILAGEPV